MKITPKYTYSNIISMRSLMSLPAFALGSFALFPGMAHAQTTVFEDDMQYANTTELQAVWSSFASSPLSGSLMDFGPAPLDGLNPNPTGNRYMKLANGVAYTDLGQTITQDWTLSVNVLHSDYQRGMRMLLLDADGEAGYGFGWNSGLVNQYGGNGSVSITKFQDTTYSDWSTFNGSADLAIGNSGHAITGYDVTATDETSSSNDDLATYDTENWTGFASISLSWKASTGLLTLSVDGEEIVTHTDTDFSSFSTIYIKGNSSNYIDNILVTVPEPNGASLVMAITALGAVAMLRRSRRQ
ncbi:hypothetical protein SH580_05980 [Coraliomargarita algicola]|uniref:PEP-CTERM protein-sorting domain-containing protein n=1 Tax=Coraliomargarita algicola TaxID=3092156 RepID=A0ABZ0RQJ7_9BACT|nr:hypothetical protein [Coraliomargarita sp. J2-16]WPJ97255.1 hypothetical protein SH580_05980 [Coraliomargarita sp. J2-16]